jgi:putative transposase
MPRQSRIDAPGAVHHIICRGIERRKIFNDDQDRDDFIKRLGELVAETRTQCFVWALIPNHFHLLLRTGDEPVSTLMRRLLTGYAIGFNRRHGRSRHLFQNRYKSILCQEDVYLKEKNYRLPSQAFSAERKKPRPLKSYLKRKNRRIN